MLNLENTMVCWNVGGDVELFAWGDTSKKCRCYEMSSGACYEHIRTASFIERKCEAFILANMLIIRDKCDPTTVHKALSGLEEYIDGLPDEMLSPANRRKRLEKEGRSF